VKAVKQTRGRPRIVRTASSQGAKQLAEFLEKKKLTNAAAGKLFSCATSYVSMLLSEQATPGLDLAARIKKVTGIECESWV
jgi:plasmid maintenance system antidote protein VapI